MTEHQRWAIAVLATHGIEQQLIATIVAAFNESEELQKECTHFAARVAEHVTPTEPLFLSPEVEKLIYQI